MMRYVLENSSVYLKGMKTCTVSPHNATNFAVPFMPIRSGSIKINAFQ